MFLEYRYDAYMSEPLWLLMNERPIPLGDGFISSLKTFDWFKDDSKCSDVTSEEDFTKLIKEIVTTEEFKASRAKLIDVVNCPEDNALDDLVASAGVVLHVKVGEKIPYIINSVEDREHIFCTVVEDMKGNLPVGEEIDVLVRTADDLKAGDEVILLLLKDSFYIYSSRNSVRPLEEKDEIKALIANN